MLCGAVRDVPSPGQNFMYQVIIKVTVDARYRGAYRQIEDDMDKLIKFHQIEVEIDDFFFLKSLRASNMYSFASVTRFL